MSRTILYYPKIEVPTSGSWVRRALLYWDDVAAIVPRGYDDYMDAQAVKRFRPEVQELYEQNIFRPLKSGKAIHGRDRSARIHDRFEVFEHHPTPEA